jgi:hypothetical protein
VYFNKFLLSIITFISVAIVATTSVSAAPVDVAEDPSTPTTTNSSDCNKSNLPIPTWYKYVPLTEDCQIPDNQNGTVVVLILMGIFDMILFLAGFIAVIMVIFGGYKLLSSNGEPQKIAAARTTIINALVGMVIAFVGSQIVGFIASRLG